MLTMPMELMIKRTNMRALDVMNRFMKCRELHVLVQSGQTSARADLLLALAVRPGVAPQTHVRFAGEHASTDPSAGPAAGQTGQDAAHVAAEGF